ncbi:MAG: hypothetical protein SH850_25955 [Planctomycetaceae bacterium]|nr:hypothetical protein [Planctomycetaceae bacterium]
MNWTRIGFHTLVVVATSSAAVSADQPLGPQYAARVAPAAAVKTVSATKPAAPAAPAKPPARDDFAARQQRLQQQQAVQDANKPTAWQLQNPSGIENRSPTSRELPGYVATNNYFGAQFRDWSNLSAPVSQSQTPANITPTTPLTQTNVMISPYSYWGADNARWSNVTISNPQMNPLGGWTISPGW